MLIACTYSGELKALNQYEKLSSGPESTQVGTDLAQDATKHTAVRENLRVYTRNLVKAPFWYIGLTNRTHGVLGETLIFA